MHHPLASLRSPLLSDHRPRSRLGIPARLRRSGGRRRFALSTAPPSSGFTHARETGATQFSSSPPAASRCSRCSRLSLSAWGSALSTQAGTQHPKHSCRIHRRQPLAFVLRFATDAGSTMAAVYANACHRPSIHRGSRLFFAGNCYCQGSSHRLSSVLLFVRTWICYVRCLRYRLPPAKHSPSPLGRCRGSAAPPNTSAKHAGPSYNRNVMQSSRFRVYSPLPLRLRLHNADD